MKNPETKKFQPKKKIHAEITTAKRNNFDVLQNKIHVRQR